MPGDESYTPPWAQDVPTTPPEDMAELLRHPPKLPSSCPQDSSLWLSGQKLNDQCAEQFGRSLLNGDWRHLTYLAMGHNDITAGGMSAIAGALAEGTAPKLQHLNLSENQIGDMGAIALAQCLHSMPELASIESVNCGYGEAGAVALMKAAKNGALQNLTSWYAKDNPIGDGGLEALCAAFKCGKLSKLNHLNLHGTNVGDEGLLVLANHIEEGCLDHVRVIYMGRIAATRDGFEVVTDVLKEYEKKTQVFF
jgi:Ran GTPase-activating protein (RanGAP) involved in mRNA processing and transport